MTGDTAGEREIAPSLKDIKDRLATIPQEFSLGQDGYASFAHWAADVMPMLVGQLEDVHANSAFRREQFETANARRQGCPF